MTLLLDTLLGELSGTPAAAGARPALRAELWRRLHRAADLINSEYTQPLSLDTLAQVAHLSRYHFVREFARRFGLPPHAYLLRKRARGAGLKACNAATRNFCTPDMCCRP